MDQPPPPPPHGQNPKTTSSNLPPGKYDIFIIPPHSSGSGFLYLPSLQPNVNSFAAGFASALVLVVLFQSMGPAFRAWWNSFQGLGDAGMVIVVIAVGVGAWALGRTQQDKGADQGGGSGGTGGSSGAHSHYQHSSGHYHQQQHSAGGGPDGPPPPPPPHGSTPPPRSGPPPGSHQHQQQSAPPPPPPPPEEEPPRPPPRDPPTPPPEEPSKPPPPPQEPPKPETPKEKPKGAWEKAREETRRREEERKAKEADQRRRDEVARRLKELREKEARERAKRERDIKEKLEAEAREKAKQEQEIREKLERETQEKEQREKEQREKEQREKVQREREQRESRLREARERELRERLERERALREKLEKEAKEREAARQKEQQAKEETARKSTYAFSAVGEKTNPWPNGKPPVQSQAPPSPSKPNGTPASAKRPPPPPSARTFNGDDAESYSYRPYDQPKGHTRRRSGETVFTESSYAPSQSTARTTPPPSMRAPYSTKDPDKIVIKAVYGFLNQFSKTPASQLISGFGPVTDGLILRITTEGLFIDDDVRGVPQREWDVKAWTLKTMEVWCPSHCIADAGSSSKPQQKSGARWRPSPRGQSKTLTGDDADSFLADLLHSCKDECRLGLHEGMDAKSAHTSSGGGKWDHRGLHVLQATIRDQEGKRYMFVLGEEEGWKMAIGLQRLRKGTQVRQLGIQPSTAAEARNTLEMLGW